MARQRSIGIRLLILVLVLVVLGFGLYEWMIRRAPVERAYVPTSFADLYANSDIVIVGSASTSARTATVAGERMSLIGVDITKCLKGAYKLGDRITVMQYSQWQDPHIVESESVFLFLNPYEFEGQTLYLINGLFDGHYKLQGDSVFPSLILNPDMEAELKRYSFSLAQIEEALGVASPRSGATPTPLPIDLATPGAMIGPTIGPDATIDPDATVDPDAIIDPDATVDPDAAVGPDAGATGAPGDATGTPPEPTITPDVGGDAATPSPTPTPSST